MKRPFFRPVVNGPIDGNAYSVISHVTRALKEAGADKEYIKEYMEEAMSKSYDNLLRVSMEYVDFNL